jgi:hypothetical protein
MFEFPGCWLWALSPPPGTLAKARRSPSHSHLDSYPKRRGFRTPVLNPGFALSFKAVQLGIDAQNVMALRMMRLASGGTHAQNEMTRMVIEKATAAAEAQVAAVGAAMAGHQDHVVAGKALNVIRKRVGANKRRLSRR